MTRLVGRFLICPVHTLDPTPTTGFKRFCGIPPSLARFETRTRGETPNEIGSRTWIRLNGSHPPPTRPSRFSPFLAFCDRVETYAMLDDCLNDDQEDFYMDDLESRRFLEELEGSAKGVGGFES